VNADVRYRFGVLNRSNNRLEFAACETANAVTLGNNTCGGNNATLRSVGYRNVAIRDAHLGGPDCGDLRVAVRIRLLLPDDVAADDSEDGLRADLRRLLGDKESADVTLEACGGKKFRAHSTLLCARSSVLAGRIKRARRRSCGEDLLEPLVVRVPEVAPEVMPNLLRYLYTDNSPSEESALGPLLAAADVLALNGLKNRVERRLSDALAPTTVASVLLAADRHGCDKLKRNALAYCRDNHAYIMKDRAWKTIEEEEPALFEEAASEVAGAGDEGCSHHADCLRKGGKRLECERNSSLPEVDKCAVNADDVFPRAASAEE